MAAYVQLTAVPFFHAQLLRGALEAEGIAVTVDRQSFDAYGLDSGHFATRVFVAAEQFEEARAVLAELEATQPPGPES